MTNAVDVIDVLGSAELAVSLEAVETRLRSEAATSHPGLAGTLTPLLAAGKRLRAALVYACAAAGDRDQLNPARVEDAMVAVELLHAATLVHDDILDSALTRRGFDTVHHALGMPAGVVAGDRLLGQAFAAAARSGQAVVHELASALGSMCDAQFEESLWAFDSRRPSSNVLSVATGKTARLFEASCRSGALVGRASSGDTAALASFGATFGLAFQLLDDLQDLAVDGDDLGDGVYTHAVTIGLTLDPPIRAMLTGPVSRAEVVERLWGDGAAEEARTHAISVFDASLESLAAVSIPSVAASMARLADLFRCRTLDIAPPER